MTNIIDKFKEQDKIAISVSACAAPSCCGVYALYDKDNNCLHVGRSVNLRQRIRNWKSASNPWSDEIYSFSFLVIPEIQAVEVELSLLRELNPIHGRKCKHGNYSFNYYLQLLQSQKTEQLYESKLQAGIT